MEPEERRALMLHGGRGLLRGCLIAAFVFQLVATVHDAVGTEISEPARCIRNVIVLTAITLAAVAAAMMEPAE